MSAYFGWLSKCPREASGTSLLTGILWGFYSPWKRTCSLHRKDALRNVHMQLLSGEKRGHFFPLKDVVFLYGAHMIIAPSERKWHSCPFSVSLAPWLRAMVGPFHMFRKFLFIIQKRFFWGCTSVASSINSRAWTEWFRNQWGYNSNQRFAEMCSNFKWEFRWLCDVRQRILIKTFLYWIFYGPITGVPGYI